MKNDAVLIVRLPASVKAKLRRAAEREVRTLSNLATWVLTQWADGSKGKHRRPRAPRPTSQTKGRR
jgi:hypothetical protein